MTFEEILSKQHYVHVPFSMRYRELSGAADSFLRFLKEVPDGEKRKLHFESLFKEGTASGYTDKRNIDRKDHKEFFHFSPDLWKKDTFREMHDAYPAMKAFINVAEAIYNEADAVCVNILQEHFPDLVDDSIVEERLGNAFLRFLCYTPDQKKQFTAKKHYDVGHGTLALAESTPGLRIGCCSKHLELVEHVDGKAVFMPGLLMWEDLNKTVIPSWHDVVVDEATSSNDRCERWAIVFFINDINGRYPGVEASHTELPVHST